MANDQHQVASAALQDKDPPYDEECEDVTDTFSDRQICDHREVSPQLRCGLCAWRPAWLQPFASKKVFLVVQGLIGLFIMALNSYFIGTLSTFEKRFQIPSTTSGVISSSYKVGYMLALVALGYVSSRGRKPRYIAAGSLAAGLGSFVFVFPHLLYGEGADSHHDVSDPGATLTASTSRVHLCGSSVEEECASEAGSLGVPTIMFIIANLMTGGGTAMYFTLSVPYLDDNTSKDKAPVLLAVVQALRVLGPPTGFALASFALAQYVDPSTKPAYGPKNPRWIGAWWLGYCVLGAALCLMAPAMAMFPPQLPRTAARRRALSSAKKREARSRKSVSDLLAVIRRLVRNRVFMLNTFSTVCFVFGYSGYWTFMPKYIETMFRQTASWANFLMGSVGLVFTVLGTVAAGVIIRRLKPSAQALAAWSVFIEVLDVLGYGSWAFLGCPIEKMHGAPAMDGSWNLTASCNAGCSCDSNIRYEPVCGQLSSINFYSPCHAGCTLASLSNRTRIFNDCACLPKEIVFDGTCPTECSTSFTIFLLMQSILKFLQATGKAGNMLIQLRSVDEGDKPMSITFRELVMSILVYIPAPIIYGLIFDSMCLVWGESCGQSGNCWLYDGHSLRYIYNFTTAGFLACGLALDIGVWYYAKGLNMYDDNKKNENADNGDNHSVQKKTDNKQETIPLSSPCDTVSTLMADSE